MFKITEDQEKAIRSRYSHLLNQKSEAYHSSVIRAIAAAQALTDSVNEIGFDYETFASVLANEHRTLQQNTMRGFIAFCNELAKHDKDGYHDTRNEASCKLATEIMKLPHYLPLV